MEKALFSTDFNEMDTRYRANFFNSVMGFKSVVLVGTQSSAGQNNLAIFSSLFHMGSRPPVFGLLFRPSEEVARHTLHNIEQTGFYTLNNILSSFTQKAHQTSAKYPADVDEFEACGLEKTFIQGFKAPFVAASSVRLGMKWVESIPIAYNNTKLVIGEVLSARVPLDVLQENGRVDIEKAGTVTGSGLDSYHLTQMIAQFPYARPS